MEILGFLFGLGCLILVAWAITPGSNLVLTTALLGLCHFHEAFHEMALDVFAMVSFYYEYTRALTLVAAALLVVE